MELKNYEMSNQVSESHDPRAEISRIGSAAGGIIPANTQVKTELSTRMGSDKVQVCILYY